jgi:hypothetical protein
MWLPVHCCDCLWPTDAILVFVYAKPITGKVPERSHPCCLLGITLADYVPHQCLREVHPALMSAMMLCCVHL